jgi:acyl-CoA dehydrogenase
VPPAVEEALRELGELAGGELYRMQLADRLNEPRLVQWDAWGNRIDEIELSPLWRRAERLAAEFGLVAPATSRSTGRWRAPCSSRWCTCSIPPPTSTAARWR